ncbi:hypothetical protein MMC17_005584 [Xylographa soralifera]|nr:hypothetical protein [Xylographa soralifera]
MEGYAKLAAVMGRSREAAIFRRFDALRIQNLLYLLAELVGLELEFRDCSSENEKSEDMLRALFAKDWYILSEYNDGNEEQWALALRIREKLKEYGDALLRQSQLCQLGRPSPMDLEGLKEWMTRPSMGDVYLVGRDRNIWEAANTHDMISLQHRERETVFSRWVTKNLLRKYHNLIGRHIMKAEDPELGSNTIIYSLEGRMRVVAIVEMSVASILPIAAISALYYVTSMPVRIVMVAAFTVCFTFCLGLLTDAKSIDMFAAATAWVRDTDCMDIQASTGEDLLLYK